MEEKGATNGFRQAYIGGMVIMSNITVIGAGYVGLVTATCFAELGHQVSVLEIDPEKVSILRQGIMPVHEPGLSELWQRNSARGRLRLADEYTAGLKDSEFAFIAVGTPSTTNGKPDLRWVRSAAKSIATTANNDQMIVVIKSTVPVGTANLVAGILAHYSRNNHCPPVVSNPEFLREGLAVFDFMHPSRVVIGTSDANVAQSVANLFASLDSPIIICDSRTAEMSKYASNVFLATRISFINEIARLCDRCGVDVVKVARIMGMDPRCGKSYLNAGVGWGGSCLPKDVRGLLHMAKNHGISLPILRAVQQINQQQPQVVVAKLQRLLGSVAGKTVGILGLSFKPDSGDMREAISLSVIAMLEENGCKIKAYDPLAMKVASSLMPELTYCRDAYEVAAGSDALVLVTEWSEFKELDMPRLRSLMNHPILIDGRNLYEPEEVIHAGFIYEGIGRGVSFEPAETVSVRGRKGELQPAFSNPVASVINSSGEGA
jgi:UDPglucose 6-dehydrogenase